MATTESQKRLTVGTVTYRRTDICLETIEKLLRVITPRDELVVVEQGGNEVEAVCDQRWPGRVIFYNLEKPSMTGARNHLIQYARGQVVLFVDDDVGPSPTLLEGHWAAYADPRIGGVAGRILSPRSNGTAPAVVGDFWPETNFEATVPAGVPHARGCNMSYRREVLLAIGGYDTGFKPPFFFREDSDVGFRVRAAGYRIRFVPEAELLHLEAKTGGARGATEQVSAIAAEIRAYKKNYAHYRDSLYFLFKHFHGKELRQWVWYTYRNNVGISRYPWRLAAKNYYFFKALYRARRDSTANPPPYFQSSSETKKPASVAGL